MGLCVGADASHSDGKKTKVRNTQPYLVERAWRDMSAQQGEQTSSDVDAPHPWLQTNVRNCWLSAFSSCSELECLKFLIVFKLIIWCNLAAEISVLFIYLFIFEYTSEPVRSRIRTFTFTKELILKEFILLKYRLFVLLPSLPGVSQPLFVGRSRLACLVRWCRSRVQLRPLLAEFRRTEMAQNGSSLSTSKQMPLRFLWNVNGMWTKSK